MITYVVKAANLSVTVKERGNLESSKNEDVYNKVEVTLSTHDAGGVTEKDIKLARAMDSYAG